MADMFHQYRSIGFTDDGAIRFESETGYAIFHDGTVLVPEHLLETAVGFGWCPVDPPLVINADPLMRLMHREKVRAA